MAGIARSSTLSLATGATLSLWLVAGCGSNNSPSAPSATIPNTFPVATGPYSITGVVAANGQPVANAAVNAWIETPGSGYSYWYAHGPLHTDASGAFQLASLPGSANVWVKLNADGYVQPCAASVVISGNLTMNVALVSTADVTGSPVPSARGLRSISGTVVEMTAAGAQSVGGASVSAAAGAEAGDTDFAPSENPAAYTVTDTAGRFALCNLATDSTVYLEADGPGNASAQVSVAPGQTGDVVITLPSSTSGIGSRGRRVHNARSGGVLRH